MSSKDHIVFGKPSLSEAHVEQVSETLRSGWIGRGPKTSEFEKRFCNYIGIKNGAAVSSCTAALHCAALGVGLGKDDEVIVPAMTFAASANAFFHAGAKVKFVDCYEDDYCLDPADLERKISSETKAVVPVHMHGQRCDMDSIFSLLKSDVKVIEDAAHSIELKGMGERSHAVCFSFYPTKNITTIEGGVVASKDQEVVDQVRIYAAHGLSADAWTRFSDQGYRHYLVSELGFKYNMTDVQAALGMVELDNIEKYQQRRQQIWKFYQESFEALEVIKPREYRDHAYHLYAIRIDDSFKINRDEFMYELFQKGIGCGVHYRSLCEHPYYQKISGVEPLSCPNAFKIGNQTLSLPFSQYLSDEDVQRIVETVTDLVGKFRK